ncbi:lipoprotein insertase outer membrane protein LolB [Psychromonas sp. MME2]|uniref:lipoprotein insertase outer membrane protein LolB n=1 Tax=unclassified Psychromonas TaxID=2614957 RepID=UPI00339C1A6C
MKKLLFSLLLVLFVSGCAQRPAPQISSWQQHQARLQALHNWDFHGKIAFFTTKERRSLNIHWQQTGDDFHINLTTFIGTTILDIQKSEQGTKITDDDGKIYWGDDAQLLIKQLSGLTLPIDNLQQWIKGNPNGARYQLNDHNNVATLSGHDLEKSDWLVEYQQYEATQGINLPYSIQLKHHDLRLKFAISEWHIE